MDINPLHLRDHLREERLSQLLGDSRTEEISAQRPAWGSNAEIIMRRGFDVGRQFFCYPSLDRGAYRARALIEAEETRGSVFTHGAVIVADVMGQSKGRFNRQWYAPLGGIWLNLVLSPTCLPENRNFYSLITGIACCESIRDLGVGACIKWVNDIHHEGRKLAGTLIESYTSKAMGHEYLLLGMGINVNNAFFPEELRSTAISLREILGKEVPLEAFLVTLLTKLGWYLGILSHFEQQSLECLYDTEKPPNPLIEQWKYYSDTLGRRVLYGFNVYEEALFEARALDIDEGGALLLLREDEDVPTRELSGEIIYL